jgi:hypothetical protein
MEMSLDTPLDSNMSLGNSFWAFQRHMPLPILVGGSFHYRKCILIASVHSSAVIFVGLRGRLKH